MHLFPGQLLGEVPEEDKLQELVVEDGRQLKRIGGLPRICILGTGALAQ